MEDDKTFQGDRWTRGNDNVKFSMVKLSFYEENLKKMVSVKYNTGLNIIEKTYSIWEDISEMKFARILLRSEVGLSDLTLTC